MYSNSAVGPIFKATRWWPEAPCGNPTRRPLSWSPVALDGRCTPTGSRQFVFNSPTKACRDIVPFSTPLQGVDVVPTFSWAAFRTSRRRFGSEHFPDVVRAGSRAVQRRRWESNPLECCFAGSRRTVWLQRHKRPRQESNLDLNLRRVACQSSTPRGRNALSSPPRS